MAQFEVDGDELRLRFSTLEALGALRTRATVSLKDVESIRIEPKPWAVLSGLRFGTAIPFVVLLGSMLRSGGNDIVALYGRRPAIVVTLRAGAPYQRLIASAPPDAEQVVRQLEAAVSAARH
jgi:hypothetical protein